MPTHQWLSNTILFKLKTYCVQVFHCWTNNTLPAIALLVLICQINTNSHFILGRCWMQPNVSWLFLLPVTHQMLFFLAILLTDVPIKTPTKKVWSFFIWCFFTVQDVHHHLHLSQLVLESRWMCGSLSRVHFCSNLNNLLSLIIWSHASQRSLTWCAILSTRMDCGLTISVTFPVENLELQQLWGGLTYMSPILYISHFDVVLVTVLHQYLLV